MLEAGFIGIIVASIASFSTRTPIWICDRRTDGFLAVMEWLRGLMQAALLTWLHEISSSNIWGQTKSGKA
jgi:hypothetical protein